MEPSRITDTAKRSWRTVTPFTCHITQAQWLLHQSGCPTPHLHLDRSFHAKQNSEHACHLSASCPGLRHTNTTLPGCVCVCRLSPKPPECASEDSPPTAQLFALLLFVQPAHIQFPHMQLCPHPKFHHLSPETFTRKCRGPTREEKRAAAHGSEGHTEHTKH